MPKKQETVSEIEMTDFKKARLAPCFFQQYISLHFLNKNITPPKPESPRHKKTLPAKEIKIYNPPKR